MTRVDPFFYQSDSQDDVIKFSDYEAEILYYRAFSKRLSKYVKIPVGQKLLMMMTGTHLPQRDNERERERERESDLLRYPYRNGVVSGAARVVNFSDSRS